MTPSIYWAPLCPPPLPTPTPQNTYALSCQKKYYEKDCNISECLRLWMVHFESLFSFQNRKVLMKVNRVELIQKRSFTDSFDIHHSLTKLLYFGRRDHTVISHFRMCFAYFLNATSSKFFFVASVKFLNQPTKRGFKFLKDAFISFHLN